MPPDIANKIDINDINQNEQQNEVHPDLRNFGEQPEAAVNVGNINVNIQEDDEKEDAENVDQLE